MNQRSLVAITRGVSPSIDRCELTHVARVPIDVGRARAQHAEYERALETLGCRVQRLPAEADMPDSVFVEDTAVVLDELSIVTRPGAASRQMETPAVAAALAEHRTLVHLRAPATMDGGDVLVAGRRIFVGLAGRTNRAALQQMHDAVEPFGYTVHPATPRGCLHLKSAVTSLDDQTLLLNPQWVGVAEFPGFDVVEVDPDEPFAANIARAGDRLLYASAFPRTRERIERRGFTPMAIDMSELAKAEGAVTCCSLILAERQA